MNDVTHALVNAPDPLVGNLSYEHKKQAFVVEYLRNGRDGPKAYQSIYRCEVQPSRVGAWRMLRDPDVSAAIRAFDEEQLAAVQKQTRITLARVVARLGTVAFADVRDLLDSDGRIKPLTELPEDVAAALAGVEINQHFDGDGNETRTYKYRLLDRNRTLDMLMQHLNGYEKHQGAVMDPLVKMLQGMRRSALPVVPEDSALPMAQDSGEPVHGIRGSATVADPPAVADGSGEGA